MGWGEVRSVVHTPPVADDLIRLSAASETWQWENSDQRRPWRQCTRFLDKQDAAAGLQEPTSAIHPGSRLFPQARPERKQETQEAQGIEKPTILHTWNHQTSAELD